MEDMKESFAGRLSLVVLALCWIFAALMTAVFVLLLSQPIGLSECVSYDPEGQRAAKVVGVGMLLALGATWASGGLALRRIRGHVVGRLALAAALPLALMGVFIGGGIVMGTAVDTVADSSDHAMCW